MSLDVLKGRLRGPLAQFTAVILLGLFVVGFGAVWASQRAGSSEALNEARSLTEQSARSIVMPNLTDELLAGDPEAIRQLDDGVRSQLLGERVVRVKLWAADGTIVYSDIPELIGETYELDPQRLEAQQRAVAVADHSHHDGPENRFEVDLGELLEVYLPIEGPNGQAMLFEAYFDGDAVAMSSDRIASTVVPIVLASLLTMGLLTLTMARRMSRRIHDDRLERERLLGRAADASVDERRQIAANLHDGVIQDLSGTALLLNSAKTNARHDPSLQGKLETASEALRHSLNALRSLAIEIHPPNIAEVNLELTLEDQLARANTSHGLQTSMTFTPAATIRDEDHKRLIYRFVTEGLRNVVKHSKASSVDLSVRDAPATGVIVSLVDDGLGFDDRAPREGLGLKLLTDLSAEVGGVVSVCGRNELGGTTLSLEIPA